MSARTQAIETLEVMRNAEQDRLTFWHIEREHLQLIEYHEELVATQELDKVDLAAEIKATEGELRKSFEAVIRKVTAIAGLWKCCEAMMAILDAEIKRLQVKLRIWTARRDRVRDVAHEVMIAMELQKVEGAADRLRRQKNPAALEVYDVLAIPDQYLKVTVRMSLREWKRLRSMIPDIQTRTDMPEMDVMTEVENAALKKVLLAKSVCPKCKGVGEVAQGTEVWPCDGCNGPANEGATGLVETVVPGARLTWGEHLRLE